MLPQPKPTKGQPPTSLYKKKAATKLGDPARPGDAPRDAGSDSEETVS